jgi:F0F1-type ATP synthase assembly protein I
MAWASQVTTIALEFSLPLVIGIVLDRWWRTMPAATLTGAVLGFVMGTLQTLRMAKQLRALSRQRGDRAREDTKHGA